MTKILLINPPYINFSGIKDSGGHAIPLNLAYIASYVREKIKCKIAVLDAEVLGLTYKQIHQQIRKAAPDFVGISCPTPTFNHVIRIAKIIKNINPKTTVIVGGSHPTAFPEDTIRVPEIDFAVRGEGEETFVDIIKTVKKSKGKPSAFKKIDGISFLEKEKPILTPERALIQDLDKIPFPARDLFRQEAYYSAATKKVSKYKSTSIMTSRGCPYNCIHCISSLVWKRKVRNRSVKNVVDEIEECVKKHGIREFNFYDDTFTINTKRVTDVCREIRRRKLKIAWICMGRVNLINREMVREMKKAGCKKISFGLESGSEKVLKLMRKAATLDLARKAVKIVKSEGIEAHASFMLGNVGETVGTIKKTIRFAKELNPDNATFFITSPFPGTDLYAIAKGKGYITEKTKWEEFAPITKSAPILIQDSLSQEELVKWQKRAFRQFYLRPAYVFRKLSKIKSFSDVKMLFEGLGVFFRVFQKTVPNKKK